MHIRTVTEDELGAWGAALDTGFLRVPDLSKEARDESAEYLRGVVDLSRTRAAFDDERIVGTFRSWGGEITAPGGAYVPVSAITNVTVTATHRRRGLLTGMMRADLDASAARGEALAILIAAEYPIYGRFGFGPATDYSLFRVDLTRTKLRPAVRAAAAEDGGRVALVAPEAMLEAGPAVHEAFRRRTPGAITRQEAWWPLYTGVKTRPGRAKESRFWALYSDAAGTPRGYLAYRVDEVWEDFVPKATLHVDQLIGATPAAEAALWEYATQIDYLAKLSAGERTSDDLLPDLFDDPRQVTWDSARDFVWVRPIDVPAALSARTYPVPGRLVLRVEDPMGYVAGTFAVDGGPDGARCVPVDEPADLALDAGTLGALYLGGRSAVRLAAAGDIAELTPGALDRAEVMFRTARAPWCPDWF